VFFVAVWIVLALVGAGYAKECPDERPVCIKRAKDKDQTCLRCGTDLAKEALPDEGAFCIDREKERDLYPRVRGRPGRVLPKASAEPQAAQIGGKLFPSGSAVGMYSRGRFLPFGLLGIRVT
jgi:hypothetical protein